MKLIINGKEAELNQKVSLRDGEGTLIGWRAPGYGSNGGRVYIQQKDWKQEFFPSVVGGQFIEGDGVERTY